MEDSQILAEAVLTKSPAEADERYKRFGYVENSCRALGLACRFRGLEMVKTLVENGATFRYVRPEGQGGYFTIYYWLSPLEMTKALRTAYFINSDPCFGNSVSIHDAGGVSLRTLNVLPIEERAEIVKYLYENRERVGLDAGELLFYSIMSGSKKITDVLKQLGARFSEKRIAMLTESGRSFEWMEFCQMMDNLDDGVFIETIRDIVEGVGGKTLHFTESVYWSNYNPYRKQFRLFRPDIFKFILENFNQKKMNKTQTMKDAIEQNSVQCLKLCAENGWLKQPRKRDEMIQYATEKGMTECTAFLLDFKNRTADLVKEQASAEKKMLRELNADPNSVTELKKIWSFDNREDGSVIITRYKGKRTEIEVPAKIGKKAVTAVGEFAFSSDAPRLTVEQRNFRRTITKVKLPDSIQSIGKAAFQTCWKMSELNIPDSVVEIGDNAFSGCQKVTEFIVPESVEKMGNGLFAGCTALRSVKLPESTTEISDYMFANCRDLQEIKLPVAVQRIGRWAFSRCSSLEEIVVPDGVEKIDRQAFMCCGRLKTVVLPASVKSIKNYKYRNQAPETIFQDSPNVTVIVEPKSYAEKYCKRYDIKYKYREDA